MLCAAVVVDLPVRGVDVGEAGTGAVADEMERIARRRPVAGEVHDSVAVGLPEVEYEGVIAGVAGETVVAGAAIERVVAGIAEDVLASSLPTPTRSAEPCCTRASTFAVRA